MIAFIGLNASAQVGIGVPTANINASAQLEVASTSKGLLLPRLTTAQVNAISNPAPGLMVYNTTTGKFVGYAAKTIITTLQQLSNSNQSNGLGYMNDPFMGSSNNTDGQTFTIANASTLSSIIINLNNVSGGSSSNVTVSVYSGSIGAPNSIFNFSNPVASSTQTITSTGDITFNFTPTVLAAGNYYFNVTCDNMNYRISNGGGFIDTDSNGNTVNESFFQTGQNGYNNYQSTSNALFFKIGLTQSSIGWYDLN